MSETIVIQKGSTRDSYLQNFERTIASPVDIEKVQEILNFLKEKGYEDSETYRYLLSNLGRIFAWGSKTHHYAEQGFQEVKESEDGYMCLIAGDDVRYLAKLTHVNDINDEEVNGKIAEYFWNDEDYKNIWFLKDIRSVEGFTRGSINSILNLDVFESVFSGNMADNLRKVDNDVVEEEKLDKLIDDLKSNSEKIEIEQEAPVMTQEKIDIVDLLENKKQVILYGPPGTGKTYKSKQIAYELLSSDK